MALLCGRLACAELSGTHSLCRIVLSGRLTIFEAVGTVPNPTSWLGLRHLTASVRTSTSEPASASGRRSVFEETREAWRPQQGMAARGEAAPDISTATASSFGPNVSDRPRKGGPAADKTGKGDGNWGVTTPEMDEVYDTLQDMGLQPGRNCVVGDGLALVDVGLYLQGVKVALEMEESRPAHTMAVDARGYALKRAMRTAIQAHGWHLVTLVASDWRKLDADQRPHYLAHCINHALGGDRQPGEGGHGHHHHHGGSCGSGCSHH